MVFPRGGSNGLAHIFQLGEYTVILGSSGFSLNFEIVRILAYTGTRIAFKKARSGSFSNLYYDHTILEIYSFFKQIKLYASGF